MAKALRNLNVALAGLGGDAPLLVYGLESAKGTRLVAVADENENALAAANFAGDVPRFSSYDQLLEQPGIDAIEINLPPESAAPLAEKALKAGLHVSLAFPFFTDAEQAERLRETARRSGKILRPLMPLLCHGPVVEAQKLLDDELLGNTQVIRIKSTLSQCGGYLEGFSPLYENPAKPRCDRLYEPLALLSLLGRVQSVFVFPGDTPDLIQVHFADKRMGVFEAVRASELAIRSFYAPQDISVEIAGTDGLLTLDRLIGIVRNRPALSYYVQNTWVQVAGFLDVDYKNAFKNAASKFAQFAVAGKFPDGLYQTATNMLKLLAAVETSASEEREVLL